MDHRDTEIHASELPFNSSTLISHTMGDLHQARTYFTKTIAKLQCIKGMLCSGNDQGPPGEPGKRS